MKKAPRKSSNDSRKFKKRVSPLTFEESAFIDYKDVDLLSKFISDRAKIRTRRVTGNTIQQQKEIARAIKNAREMGLIAYTSRVTTQRRGKRDDRRDDRRNDKPERNEEAIKAVEENPAAPEVAEAVTEAVEAEVVETVEAPEAAGE